MTDRHQITLKAEVDSLEKLWEFISAVCAEYGLTEETVNDIHLAVDEACSNIIAHGYDGMPAGEMRLSLQFDADQVQVEITDQGRGFEPAEIPEPDVDAPIEVREPGGFGWFLIQQVMDEVVYYRTDNRNRLILIKKINS